MASMALMANPAKAVNPDYPETIHQSRCRPMVNAVGVHPDLPVNLAHPDLLVHLARKVALVLTAVLAADTAALAIQARLAMQAIPDPTVNPELLAIAVQMRLQAAKATLVPLEDAETLDRLAPMAIVALLVILVTLDNPAHKARPAVPADQATKDQMAHPETLETKDRTPNIVPVHVVRSRKLKVQDITDRIKYQTNDNYALLVLKILISFFFL